MAEDVKKSIKPLVVSLRKKGFSYSEIQKEIFVPKSTLSLWLRGEKLAPAQLKNLNQRKISALKSGAEKRIAKILQEIDNTQKAAESDIKNISKRELWLMGVVLYWRAKTLNSKKNVYFSSADLSLISLFLKWLKNIGGLGNDEIGFDIFLSRSRRKSMAKVIAFWSKITGFPASNFTHIYFQKTRNSGKSNHGFLRVRVRGSSMLYRQIAGWIDGIKKILNLV